VRSYVTSPTTMRAITDIPAKTPRPIGSTDSFLPGTVKAAAPAGVPPADAADEAAEELDAEAGAVPVLAAEVTDSLTEEVAWPAEDDAVALVDPAAVAEPSDAETLDKPFTMGPEPGAEAPVVVAAALLLPSEEEEVEPAREEAIVEVAMLEVSDPAALEEPPPLSDDKVQSLTSSTCGCPSTVMGVSVILQVWVTGPLAVLTWVIVVTVVGCDLLASSRRTTLGR